MNERLNAELSRHGGLTPEQLQTVVSLKLEHDQTHQTYVDNRESWEALSGSLKLPRNHNIPGKTGSLEDAFLSTFIDLAHVFTSARDRMRRYKARNAALKHYRMHEGAYQLHAFQDATEDDIDVRGWRSEEIAK